MGFIKTASLKIENPEVTIDTWIGKSRTRTASNQIVNYKKIINDFNPDNYLLTHCTIVASVDVEKGPQPVHFKSDNTKRMYEKLVGRSDYYITPETSKYMNANGDSWERGLLKKSYQTFVGAENYVEHVQEPALSKGKILDAVLREVDENKSTFVDILVATNKKHSDLVDKIKTGKLTTLSMGAVVAFTICTKCGRVAADETELCNDIRIFKKNSFIGVNDGKKRIIAELCGHFLYPESNKFIEGSWVETPAFKGAVMRNEIELNDLVKAEFAEKYAPVANMKSPDLKDTASRILNAFALVDKMQNAFLPVGQNEDLEEEEVVKPKKKKKVPPEDAPEEAPEDKPIEEAPPEETPPEDAPEEEAPEKVPVEEAPEEEAPAEDAPDDNTDEDAPPEEEAPSEETPDELKDMGEPPAEEEAPEDPALDEKAKKPYDVLKEEIKTNLKEQIKKELLRDLGINIDEMKDVPRLDDVNLNDSIINSKLGKNINLLRKASRIVKEDGLRSLFKNGYSKADVLKIAYISRKYSINKDIYKTINSLDVEKFPTFRRISKRIESEMGRYLTSKERVGVNNLLKDLFF